MEAARAGEAGLGFAVVADEVRNLAHRSANSARETAAQIEESIAKSSRGMQICDQAGRTIAEMVDKVRQAAAIADTAATSSQEQSRGIEQVSTAVIQMEKVTQTNASSAEEGASASIQLQTEAQNLKQAIHELTAMVDGKAEAVRSE